MRSPLYDHEIDAVSFLKEVRDQQRRPARKTFADWIRSDNPKARSKGDVAPSSDWIARLNLSEVMGIGVLLGSILSLPIIFLFRPELLPFAAFVFVLFLLVPVLKIASPHIKGKLRQPRQSQRLA